MKKIFLNELLNNGLIDCKASTIVPGQYIYYPLIEPMISNVDINNDNENPSFPSNLSSFDHLLPFKLPTYGKKLQKCYKSIDIL